MREAFTRQINYWEIIFGEEIASDIVTPKMIEEIGYSVLPEERAGFEVLTEEMASYVKTFDAAFLASGNFN